MTALFWAGVVSVTGGSLALIAGLTGGRTAPIPAQMGRLGLVLIAFAAALLLFDLSR